MNAAYGYVVALREALEAALVTGIVLSCLIRLDKAHLKRYVWAGVGVAILASIALAEVSIALGGFLEGRREQVFEAAVLILAAAVLTSMLLWMQRQGHSLKGELEARVRSVAVARPAWGLTALAFVMVFREGVETVILLRGAMAVGSASGGLGGAALGIATALVLAYLLFRSTLRLDLRRFFVFSGYLLILFAAGLLANGLAAWQELGLLPYAPLWDTGWLLPETNPAGALLQALLGYDPRPSLWQVLAWWGYLLGFGSWYRLEIRRSFSVGM